MFIGISMHAVTLLYLYYLIFLGHRIIMISLSVSETEIAKPQVAAKNCQECVGLQGLGFSVQGSSFALCIFAGA